MLHSLGVLGLFWMLTDVWASAILVLITVVTVLIPFVLEIAMIVGQRAQFQLMQRIQIEHRLQFAADK